VRVLLAVAGLVLLVVLWIASVPTVVTVVTLVGWGCAGRCLPVPSASRDASGPDGDRRAR
jgi:hypothetical protein